jgi:transposase
MRGRKISEDLCNVITRMLPVLDISDIQAYTGVSKSQIQRVRALYNRTGHGYKARDTRMMGRRRKLTLENIQVSIELLPFVHLIILSTVCAGSLGSQL